MQETESDANLLNTYFSHVTVDLQPEIKISQII